MSTARAKEPSYASLYARHSADRVDGVGKGSQVALDIFGARFESRREVLDATIC